MHEKYGYRNFVDGVCKIWKEKSNPRVERLLSRKYYLTSGNTFQFPVFFKNLVKIKSFYSGAFYYGLAYTAFISLEFALHDMLIEYMSEFTDSKDKSILEFLQIIPKKKEDNLATNEKDNEKESSGSHHHWHNELLSSFAAGSIGAFMTNGIEMVAVNKQANPSLSLKDILFHKNQSSTGLGQKNNLKSKIKNVKRGDVLENSKHFFSIIFQGWQARTIYYGVQATFFFLYLNHLTAYLGIDTEEFE